MNDRCGRRHDARAQARDATRGAAGPADATTASMKKALPRLALTRTTLRPLNNVVLPQAAGGTWWSLQSLLWGCPSAENRCPPQKER
jgi:hypothetical protein